MAGSGCCRSRPPAWCCWTCPTTTRWWSSTACAPSGCRARRPARLGRRPAEVRRRGPARAVPAPAGRPRRRRRPRAQPGRPSRAGRAAGDAWPTCGGWPPTTGSPRRPCLAVGASTGAGVRSCGTARPRPPSAGAATERSRATCGSRRAGLADACGRPPSTPPRGRRRAAPGRALEDAAGVPTVVDAVRRSTAAVARGPPPAAPVRWLARLRPDPLRRLGLGRERLRRSGRPGAHVAAGPGRGGAGRRRDARCGTHVDAATSGAPDAWVLAARSRAAGADLRDALDQAVRARPSARRAVPWMVARARALQWVLLAVAVAGLVWLRCSPGWRTCSCPAPETPMWGPPAPTVLLVGGRARGPAGGAGWALGARRARGPAPARLRRAGGRAVGCVAVALRGATDARRRPASQRPEMDARCRRGAGRPPSGGRAA